jgi:hypothetical protein
MREIELRSKLHSSYFAGNLKVSLLTLKPIRKQLDATALNIELTNVNVTSTERGIVE